ncbi:MAG TPA: prephenate dehydrogenase/arogenate dehydrogenase family protein [Candidatus Sulfotelmatobacter sp.]|jgi:prephenate dehydrogenase|nr:prephenate dehydrogenase/arogenate dehydrogenase family protein [Candidatus Sulfotelmatobacter sp.]
MAHLIKRVTILGTGLIGGSFARALRKYTRDIAVVGWDRPEIVLEARKSGAIEEGFFESLEPAIRRADLIYIALPVGNTLDILPEVAHHAPAHTLVTDAGSTKMRIAQAASELFVEEVGPIFLGGHPMAGRELSGFAHADANLFQDATYALIGEADDTHDPRIAAFVKILEKIGARPLWLGAQQHDYAVGLASHLPQLAAVALASFLYDRLDENGLPITLAGPGLRDTLRLAGSSYSTWRDIVLTNREVLSAALDLFARRLDDLRERLGSRELEADFDAANELYKLLRSL